MHRFYIDSQPVTQKALVLHDSRIAFQMARVLRMRRGDKFRVFNDEGREWECEAIEVSQKMVTAAVIEELQRNIEASRRVVLFQAIPKKIALFELVLQKAAELGVSEIFPLITERTEQRRLGKFDRMQNILIEATEQCGRTKVPTLRHPIDLGEALKQAKNGYLAYECEEKDHLFNFLPEIRKQKEVQIFIGPEGGLSAKEIDQAVKAGLQVVSLGKRILRTETAAIAALSAVLLDA
jgi:16S rRNA (uracil1498-N3)-methyltransferase